MIVFFSKTVSDNFEKKKKTTQLVLIRLADAGLKLKLSNSHFLQRETTLLSHVINSSGIHTSKDKTETVVKYPFSNKY